MILQVFIFPGQGAQALGMGQDVAIHYPQAKDVFDQVDDALNRKLSRIIWGEDSEELTKTQNAQPCLLYTSPSPRDA